MGAPSKRAKRVRSEGEFDFGRLAAALKQPRDGRNTIDAWSLTQIHNARDEQMRGYFLLPSRMAEAMRTDEALAVPFWRRLAPQRCIPVGIRPVHGARGEAIAAEADALYGANGIGIHAETLADIHGCLVNHGIAFGVNVATPREDGSRVDLEMKYWPIEYVQWDPIYRVFKARCDPNTVQPGDLSPNAPAGEYGFVGGFWVPIIHGDGRWVVFKKNEIDPFRQEAALLPAALVWARHAFASRDWSRGSRAHGSAKVIGELPSGVPLQVEGGGLSQEAASFIELLRGIAVDDSPAGIKPAGSILQFLTNNSTAWQVWSELVLNSEKAGARIYLGTDATLGSQGGAPGVDIGALFGVAETVVSGDLTCISRGIDTGLIQPWCAINFGDSKLAPERQYLIPNKEKQANSDAYAKRNAAYYAALVAARQAGATLTTEYVIALASDYDVRAPDLSAPIAPPPPPKPA